MSDLSRAEGMSSGNIETGLPGDAARGNAPSSATNGKAQELAGQAIDFILDVPLRITVELGTSKMTIREVLQLSVGSVISTTKFAGEALEILINNRLISRGEVVVVNEKYGVRLTDIISPNDHAK